MASSRVMASSSPPQQAHAGAGAGSSSDLARFRSSSGIGSMNMDDIIRNIYGPEAVNAAAGGGVGGPAEPSPAAALPEAAAARRTSEEVWNEISAAGGLSAPVLLPPPPAACSGTGGASGGGSGAAEMTLEDFLARDSCARAAVMDGNMALGFPDADGDAAGAVGVGGGRGSRKRALLDPADRAVMQRQKRMIKNRESAARSRDRKQAYVAELESQVTQLEEEQAELLREQEDRRQKRRKEKRGRLVIWALKQFFFVDSFWGMHLLLLNLLLLLQKFLFEFQKSDSLRNTYCMYIHSMRVMNAKEMKGDDDMYSHV
ncbi:bZIP transcription factor 12-like isoform X1 [Miscanthus floridulus]|uniref:bZIP transcription factor 12-like isoform X1 n=1 Tax=Miscanthus floridulus TaxID=154761 RepID=UPI003459CCFF